MLSLNTMRTNQRLQIAAPVKGRTRIRLAPRSNKLMPGYTVIGNGRIGRLQHPGQAYQSIVLGVRVGNFVSPFQLDTMEKSLQFSRPP